MNIFYFTSDLFSSVLATSMVSLLENNKEANDITFYIIDDGISNESIEKLREIVNNYHRKIEFIKAPDPSDLFDFKFKSRYQIGHSYVRMAIGTLLPRSVKKVIALDSDTLVTGSLQELWDTQLGDNIMGGVNDCINLEAFQRQFGLKKGELYCNAGFYIIDLEKWREENIEQDIRRIIREKNGNIFFFEQTLMNYVCKGRILQLHPKYNCYTMFYAFSYEDSLSWRRPTSFYSKEEVELAIKNPVIIHFTRNFFMLSRPWVKGCNHPMQEDYLRYKSLTPWKELQEDNRTLKEKIKYMVWHSIPRYLLPHIANFLYNTVRPKLWWKNE